MIDWFSNTSRFRLQNLLKSFADRVPEQALVLDAGAGDQIYRHLFAHARYESADFEPVDRQATTYICDLANIPTESGRFDHIIFNQVLEYILEPQTVIDELYRVLKTDGTILCTCPFFWEEDRSYYYLRYTSNALKKLFTTAGFEIVSFARLEGYPTTLAYQLELAVRHLPTRPAEIGSSYAYLLSPLFGVVKAVAFVLAAILYRVDRLSGLRDFGYSKNHVVLARKPGQRRAAADAP